MGFCVLLAAGFLNIYNVRAICRKQDSMKHGRYLSLFQIIIAVMITGILAGCAKNVTKEPAVLSSQPNTNVSNTPVNTYQTKMPTRSDVPTTTSTPTTTTDIIPDITVVRPDVSPWSTFHGNVKHTGVSIYDTSHVKGTLKWSFETGAGIESSPAIGHDGTVYFGSHDGFLYALNQDGTEKWRFNAGPPSYNAEWNVTKSIMSSPAVATDGTVYIHSSSNFLFAIGTDGQEKWRFRVKWQNDFWPCPTVGPDGTVYIGSARTQSDPDFKGEGGLFAINPDGTKKWLFPDDSGVTSTAAIGDDGTIYFGGNVLNPKGQGNLGKIYALNPDGTKKWEFTTESWMESAPMVGPGGTIYTGSGREARVYAINPDGTEKWRFQAATGVSAIPAIGADGTIYVGAWDCYFYALTPDGKEIWHYKTPDAFEGIISSAAVGADGTIYVGSNSGNFYAFNPDGTIKWQLSVKGSIVTSPAIDYDGTVYFGSWNHKFYAIK